MDSDDLSAKLRAWRVEPELPASFQRGVWQRIATRQVAQETAFWPQDTSWLRSHLARSTFAVVIVGLSLWLGLKFARERAENENEESWRTLEARYAASINPLATHGTHPSP